MAKTNFPVISSNSGELSPKIDARTDIQKYSSGCRILENMIPTIYGGAERTPGTKYIVSTKNNGVAILVPFKYSSTIAYQVEFGNQYARFFYDGGQVVDGETVVEIETPYLEADLYQLQFRQINDVMWILHNSYPQRKLKRVSPVSFTLEEIVFDNGPFLKRNDLKWNNSVTMTPSVIVKDTSGTLTASANTFQSGHVGALFKLTQPRVNVVESLVKTGTDTGVSSTTGINVKGDFKLTTEGAWYGTAYFERMEDGVNWETYMPIVSSSAPGHNLQYQGTEEADNVFYRINLSAHTSGSFTGTISVDDSTQSGIVRVDSYTSATVVNVTVVVVLASTDATKRWYEGAWSGVRGYPRTLTFFEERAVYAGSTYEPQAEWKSESGDYENFEEGDKDADSFSLTIPSSDAIRWIESLEALVIGTAGGEWRIRATSNDEALTPTNYNIRQQTDYGGAAMQAIKVNEAVLFVDYPARKVREMVFDDSRQKFTAPDLTVLAEHITESGIISFSYQKNPESILWCVRDDGVLISMTYEKEQKVLAWARHPMDGLVESVSVIPSDLGEDEVWLIVNRTINGSTVRYIEQMQPRDWGDNDEDCFFVDSGLVYDGVATTTITGLTHLIGETVAILGNGSVHPSQVVPESGELTLTESVTKAIVGLPYTYKWQPMLLDASSEYDTTRGSIRKIYELVVSFLNTSGAKYGRDVDNLFDFEWRTEEEYGEPPALFTGDKVVTFDGGFSAEDPILITGSEPLPCTIRCVVTRMEKTGR